MAERSPPRSRQLLYLVLPLEESLTSFWEDSSSDFMSSEEAGSCALSSFSLCSDLISAGPNATDWLSNPADSTACKAHSPCQCQPQGPRSPIRGGPQHSALAAAQVLKEGRLGLPEPSPGDSLPLSAPRAGPEVPTSQHAATGGGGTRRVHLGRSGYRTVTIPENDHIGGRG